MNVSVNLNPLARGKGVELVRPLVGILERLDAKVQHSPSSLLLKERGFV
jgi:hypothetical protein